MLVAHLPVFPSGTYFIASPTATQAIFDDSVTLFAVVLCSCIIILSPFFMRPATPHTATNATSSYTIFSGVASPYESQSRQKIGLKMSLMMDYQDVLLLRNHT